MATTESLEQLIQRADAAAQETLAYLEGPGRTSATRIDRWGVKDVTAHLLFWHKATAETLVAALRGEDPRRFTEPVDHINEQAIAEYRRLSLAQMTGQLRGLHQQLLENVRMLPNPDVVVMYRADGSAPTAKDRLRAIAHHWANHLKEMQSAR